MRAIANLQKLQTDYSRAIQQTQETYAALASLLDGGPKDLAARLKEAKESFLDAVAKISPINPNDHGPMSPDHEYRPIESGRYQFIWRSDCPGCLRLLRLAKAEAIFEELNGLEAKRRNIMAAKQRWDESVAQARKLLANFNAAGQKLGIPSFEVKENGDGRITGVGRVNNFPPANLKDGYYVEQLVNGNRRRTIFDDAEHVVAYEVAPNRWNLTGLGPRYVQSEDEEVSVKVRGGYSIDRQAPTTDIIIAHRDGSGDHQHVVVDDQGNEITNKHTGGKKKPT